MAISRPARADDDVAGKQIWRTISSGVPARPPMAGSQGGLLAGSLCVGIALLPPLAPGPAALPSAVRFSVLSREASPR